MLGGGRFLGQNVSSELLRQARAQALIQMGASLMGVHADPGAAIGQGLQSGLGAYNQIMGAGIDLQRQQEMDRLRREQFESVSGYRDWTMGHMLPEGHPLKESLPRLAPLDPEGTLRSVMQVQLEVQEKADRKAASAGVLEAIGNMPGIKGLVSVESLAPLAEHFDADQMWAAAEFSANLSAIAAELARESKGVFAIDVTKVADEAGQLMKNLKVTGQVDPETKQPLPDAWRLPPIEDLVTGEKRLPKKGPTTTDPLVAYAWLEEYARTQMYPEASKQITLKAMEVQAAKDTIKAEEAQAKRDARTKELLGISADPEAFAKLSEEERRAEIERLRQAIAAEKFRSSSFSRENIPAATSGAAPLSPEALRTDPTLGLGQQGLLGEVLGSSGVGQSMGMLPAPAGDVQFDLWRQKVLRDLETLRMALIGR
jgi:ribosomal 30S subunit maturation factor RimM